MPVWILSIAIATFAYFLLARLLKTAPKGLIFVCAMILWFAGHSVLGAQMSHGWTAWTANHHVRKGLNRYLVEHKKVPSTADQFQSTLRADTGRDDWGRWFLYEKVAPHHVKVISRGRDGQARTADDIVCDFFANPVFETTDDCYSCGWYLPISDDDYKPFQFSNFQVFLLFHGALGLLILGIFLVRGKKAKFNILVLLLGIFVLMGISCNMLDNATNRGSPFTPYNCLWLRGHIRGGAGSLVSRASPCREDGHGHPNRTQRGLPQDLGVANGS